MNVVMMPRRVDQRRCHVAPGRSATVCVLDVGTTKVVALVAKLRPADAAELLTGRTHSIDVIGYGVQQSRGVKSGKLVDLRLAENAIRRAVDAAEQMAGVTVESLIVAQTAGRLGSELYDASVDLDTGSVRESDIRQVLKASGEHQITDGRTALHALPIGYSLDGQDGILDPRSMVGDRLGVEVNLVTADRSAQDNLALAIHRCHLDVDGVVAGPYASALSSLVDDEADLGAACVDIGGGTSTIAIFSQGHLVHVDAIAIGGKHITQDIAHCLSIGMEDAERLKVLEGSAIQTTRDQRDTVTIAPVGEDGQPAQTIPRGTLNAVVRPRVDEILELIRERLVRSGFAGRIGRRVVMTGGGSQLTGLTDVARQVFGRPVRLGRPLGVKGLPLAARGSAFSAVVGLLIYPQLAPASLFDTGRLHQGGAFARVGRWLKESF